MPMRRAAPTSASADSETGQIISSVFFFQAEDGIRDADVTGVQTCALPISSATNAVPSNSNTVVVTWTDNSANEDGFRVERSPDGGTSWAPASTTSANVTSLTDGGRSSEQQVCYHVIAFNAGGDSRSEERRVGKE